LSSCSLLGLLAGLVLLWSTSSLGAPAQQSFVPFSPASCFSWGRSVTHW
jgi:hypothetical protein